MRIFPRTKDTAGPHSKSVELASIPRRTIQVVHEHEVSQGTWNRFKKYGYVPNRANRRAYARSRNVAVPRATLVPYERGATPRGPLGDAVPVF